MAHLVVVGEIWQHGRGLCSYTYSPSPEQAQAIRDLRRGPARAKAVLRMAPDFQSIRAFLLKAGTGQQSWAADDEAGAFLAEVA